MSSQRNILTQTATGLLKEIKMNREQRRARAKLEKKNENSDMAEKVALFGLSLSEREKKK